MLRTFLVIVIFSTLIVSNINLCEAKRLNHQIGKMKTCSIKCAPPFCRIKCIPTTITPTTATSTIMTSTAETLTTMTSTTNTKTDYTENQEVIILVFFFKMKFLFYYCCNFYFHSRKNQNILVYGCHLPHGEFMANLNWSAFQN